MVSLFNVGPLITLKSVSYPFLQFYRAVDVHSLLGYVGGYVGLLLGFSIVQIPEFLLLAFKRMKTIYSDRLRVQSICPMKEFDNP